MDSWICITGATGGLGKAFAVECASRGWNVFLTDLRHDLLETLAGGLRHAYGVQVRGLACDLADPAARSRFFKALAKARLPFWGVINVAGTDYEGAFYERTREQIRAIVRLNVEGTLEVTHALMQHRDPFLPFRIINVASLAAFSPMPVKATYAASKRFLVDFSLALREEVRPLGATVTVLCPGGLPTNPEVIQAIQAQGLAGLLTTQQVGAVAARTLDQALAGRAVVIPGFFNLGLQILERVAPVAWTTSLIGSRWRAARHRRGLAPGPWASG